MNISRKLEVKIYLIIIGITALVYGALFYEVPPIPSWLWMLFDGKLVDHIFNFLISSEIYYYGILVFTPTFFIFRTGYLFFVKAGYNGWLILIPIYNLIILFKIVNRPLWWLIFLLIPIANLVIMIIVSLDLAKSFGKDMGFGLGLAFLGFIFFPILAFGDAEYSFPDRVSENSNNNSDDSSEELSKYKKMFDDGIITQEEYDAKRKQILGL